MKWKIKLLFLTLFLISNYSYAAHCPGIEDFSKEYTSWVLSKQAQAEGWKILSRNDTYLERLPPDVSVLSYIYDYNRTKQACCMYGNTLPIFIYLENTNKKVNIETLPTPPYKKAPDKRYESYECYTTTGTVEKCSWEWI